MMKYLVWMIVACMVIVVPVRAATPNQQVWFTPLPGTENATLAAGDSILVYAKLSNLLPDPVTYAVSFAASGATIGTKTVSVLGYSAQEISIPWTMPAKSTEVTVVITKATDKNKKQLTALMGPLGSTTIGAAGEKLGTHTVGPLTGWVGRIVDTLEGARLKYLAHFTKLKDKADGVLATTTLQDASNLLQPDEQSGDAQPAPSTTDEKAGGSTFEYVTLIYATIGKAFFGSKPVYFVTLILAGLLVLRLFFKLLFR